MSFGSARYRKTRQAGVWRLGGYLWLLLFLLRLPGPAAVWADEPASVRQTLTALSALRDRSTGSPGSLAAAQWIEARFRALALGEIGRQRFVLPILKDDGCHLQLSAEGSKAVLRPLRGNLLSPPALPPEGVSGPLIYVGDGQPARFNGHAIPGAIVAMDLDSGRNWQNAASLGARALIYVDRRHAPRPLFQDKAELTPLDFPRFYLGAEQAAALFGELEGRAGGQLAAEARLQAQVYWQEAEAENIWCLVPGSEAKLGERLVIVEAPYDSEAWVLGDAPGADEALGVASLLELAAHFKTHPPARSVLLVASAGHGQALAGMREMVWSLHARTRDLRDLRRQLDARVEAAQAALAELPVLLAPAAASATPAPVLGAARTALVDRLKSEADILSRELMQRRLAGGSDADPAVLQDLARRRLGLRQLSWHPDFRDLSDGEQALLRQLVPRVLEEQQAVLEQAGRQLTQLASSLQLRERAKAFDIDASISLHLSSHGDGVGAFSQGWLYDWKPSLARATAYTPVAERLEQAARQVPQTPVGALRYQDTLRGDRLRPWRDFLPDRPALGGEVAALAGWLGLSLATTHDLRLAWGTPHDRLEAVDLARAAEQSRLVGLLIDALIRAPRLQGDTLPPAGFATLTGRARFLRHGELFADQPAPGSTILAYQGPARMHAMVDAAGQFQLKGVADKSVVLDKVILEGYRFDPQSGSVQWAIDKRATGKDAYRVKMQHASMETDLVMFGCRQSTLFGLLEPRSFRYLTLPQLLDARTEALPSRYWYSRSDTRNSTNCSLYLEPGTRFKLTHSDTVLGRKLLLLHASPERPEGEGYRVDQWPALWGTEWRVAKDMWTLLAPRVAKLETHGVVNAKLRALQQEGLAALAAADRALEQQAYDRFLEAARNAWALAIRVYEDVERTQKDVLLGVLFYIALFVPFAFCLERLLFACAGIYQRLAAFSGILVALIALIYAVHPAFQLAYSPMVVILAFFIMGMSGVVTVILMARFEQEMAQLQRHAHHVRPAEVGRFKAFVAAFLLGVSNLRRRPVRTALTIATLVMLTFTIMSFTTVKSIRMHSRLPYQPSAPYRGMLFKVASWGDLPPDATEAIRATLGDGVSVAPRIWLDNDDPTQTARILLRSGSASIEARGVIGLSAEEAVVSGIARALVQGRWLQAEERRAVLLPEGMAQRLDIRPDDPQRRTVTIWGQPFTVVGVFSPRALQALPDLDGESLTPVTFPSEVSQEMTEAEMDAIESGEELRSFQSRYHHLPYDETVILPWRTLLPVGGALKSVAVSAPADRDGPAVAAAMADRFGLTLFSGEENGIFLYNASDTLSYSGLPNVAVPLALAVLIVLNTMIGSVYERRREIAVYTSVGLAPSHVGFLFVAEALALAVLSVVLGYLVAQSAAGLLGDTLLRQGITVNYSSLAGVAAMALVVLVVLISVIYPARVASQIAIPDVHRSWSLPAAVGDRLSASLPFLMRYHEHASIGGFVLEFLNAHRDISHGAFAAGEVSLAQSCPLPATPSPRPAQAGADESCLTLLTRIWLAPFDFGIVQDVSLRFCPSADEPGYLEIAVEIHRQAGEANLWHRANRAFLLALRRQLLVWRSLDAEQQKRFAAALQERLGAASWSCQEAA